MKNVLSESSSSFLFEFFAGFLYHHSMQLIDTHAHLTYEPLAVQIEQVLDRSRRAGVGGWITVGTSPQENRNALDLAGRFEKLWAAVGYHPHHAGEITEADLTLLKETAGREKVAAIGETGLDYHYMHAAPEHQQRIFRAQLDIAAEVQKPVVIHARQAFDESMQILAEYDGRLKGVVIHCYGGDRKQTELVLERGYFVALTGIVTFKNAGELREAAKMIPPERLMIETDCPYISPEPVRKIQPNEPALLVHTARRLAELRGMELEEFAALVTKNSIDFFNLQDI